MRSDGKLIRENALNWIRANVLPTAEDGRGAARVQSALNRDFRRGPPVPWLQPVHDEKSPFAAGVLFGLIAMSRQIRSLGALAALDGGASIPVARVTGDMALAMFVEAATELMTENEIGPFACNPSPPIWRREEDLHVDWKKVAKSRGEPFDLKAWDAYSKERKAALKRPLERTA